MKKLLAIILSMAIFLGCINAMAITSYALGSQTYYIDSISGNDLNVGTSPDDAWRTVENIKTLSINAGDKVLFRCGGTYSCELTLTCSGTKDSPIVISSYGEGNDPVLTTQNATEVLRLFDCSYVTLTNLELTAHNGGGIWIDTLEQTSYGITLNNLVIHDIQNYKVNSRDTLSAGASVARACVMVKGLPAHSRYAVNDLTITDCEMFDCGNGISMWGSWNDTQTPWCESEDEIDPIYNTGFLVKGCYFHDMDAEAIIIGMCNGALVTNCRAIDCCQGDGLDENGNILFFNAAVWFWGSESSTVEYCEIAGQKNFGDGMAVDFDSHSNNCTYQYIYSHDNTRFMCNCPNYSGQHGNTVRYCLSVNDNKGRSRMAGKNGEYGFRFYNNTLVNCGEVQMNNIYDALIANNIFDFADSGSVSYDVASCKNNVTFSNNCYYNYANPIVDFLSRNCQPGFVSNNTDDKNSYALASDSPLIGAGTIINDGLTEDFFGNSIDSANIGCYSGSGLKSDTEYPTECIFAGLIRHITYICKFFRHEIYALFN